MNLKDIKKESYFILLASGLMMFLINFDIPGVNLAVPEIMFKFNSDISIVQWIVISYTLMASVCMIVLSMLSKHIGSKRFFIIGVTLFSIASIIISTGVSIPIIVFGRMLQGIGMAFVYPQIMVQCTSSFPQNHKGLIIGIITFIACFAQALAPALSSVLIDYIGWESIFLLNVPCGIVIVFLAYKFFIKDSKCTRFKFDYFGAVILSLLLLLISLIFPLYSQLSTNFLLLYLSIIMVLLVGSYYLFKNDRNSIFKLIFLFKNRQFTYSLFIRVLFMSVFGAFIFSVNIMLREILNVSVLNTGLFFLLLTVSLSISTLITSFKIKYLGYKKGFILANTLMIISCLSLIVSPFNYILFSILLVLFGIGLGINMTSSSAGAITAVNQENAGIATSTFFTAVFLSFSAGTSLSANLLNNNGHILFVNCYKVLEVCLCLLFIALILSIGFKETKENKI